MNRNDQFLAPLTTMAVEWRLNRDRLIRAIQAGTIRGEQRYGRWLVDTRDAEIAQKIAATRRAPCLPRLAGVAA